MRLKRVEMFLFPTFLKADFSALQIQRRDDEDGWISPETGSKYSVL